MYAVNCKANLHLLRKALPIFNTNPEGGVFLITASVAGVGPSGSAMAYSVSKAAGLKTILEFLPKSLIRISSYSFDEVPCRYPRAEDSSQCYITRSSVDRMGIFHTITMSFVNLMTTNTILGPELLSGNDTSCGR